MAKKSCARFATQAQALQAFQTSAAKFSTALKNAKAASKAKQTTAAFKQQQVAERALKAASRALTCAQELFTVNGYDRQIRTINRYETGLDIMQEKYSRVRKTLY